MHQSMTTAKQRKETMTHINDFWLTEYCNDIAQDICKDTADINQAMDWASESAGGSEYVIYTAKAHMLCQNCDTVQGEDFVSDCWGDTPLSYDEMACRIAYGEIESRIRRAICEIFENKEDAA
jgi:hypothetical protein